MYRAYLFLIAASIFVFGLALDGFAGDIEVKMGWARETPPNALRGAAYMTIVNKGSENDRLIGAESDVSERTELHTAYMEQGMMKMRKVDGIDIPGGKSIELKPGAYHIMFLNLKKQLTAGVEVNITLKFEKTGLINVTVPVKQSEMGMDKMKGQW